MKKKILKLSTATICTLHCINKYIDSSSANRTTKSGDKYYHWTHGDIFYNVTGQGKPILLIHDMNVFSSSNDWELIVKKLAKTNTVYTLDLIGCGKSDKPAITYTNYFFVQMITDFIRDMIKEKTIVITSGMSASSVIMANKMNQNLFEKIFMINPPSPDLIKKGLNQHSKKIIQLFSLPIIGKTCYYIATNKTNTEDYYSEKCFYNPFKIRRTTIKSAYYASHAGCGNGKYLLASMKGGYLNIDITQALEKTDVKTVVILGEHETNAKETGKAYADINEAVRIKMIKETKKLPQLESPDQILNIITTDQ